MDWPAEAWGVIGIVGGATITHGLAWIRGRRGESREDRKETAAAIHEQFRLLQLQVNDLYKRVDEAEADAERWRTKYETEEEKFREERSTSRTYRMEVERLNVELAEAVKERQELLERLDGEVGRLRRELEAHKAAHAYCQIHCNHVPECELRPRS